MLSKFIIVQCSLCRGTGLDSVFKRDNGSPASCARCEGYGTLRGLVDAE